jgi:type II secretory pathway pseudopilin PulG
VKKKDAWDKAGVMASILSSVVIASLTLVLNSTIQRTQMDMQAQQIKAAQENAKREERNQNAKATTDLIQYLLSGEPAKQCIALIALRRAVQDDDDLVVNIVSVVASTSKDQSVYDTATDTLQASHDPRVAKILADISVAEKKQDPKRSAVAYRAAQRVGVQAAVETGTTIVYAAPPGKVAYESAKAGGGVFTYSFLQALKSTSGPIRGGVLDVSKLSDYLNLTMSAVFPDMGQQPKPFVVNDGSPNIPLSPPTKVQVLAIGVARYESTDIPPLMYATSDAMKFSQVMKSRGATVSTLIDAKQDAILEQIYSYQNSGDGTGTFVMYFSGHGWNSKGVQMLAAADSSPPYRQQAELGKPTDGLQSKGIRFERTGMALTDVMRHINQLPFRYKLVLIDACDNSEDGSLR